MDQLAMRTKQTQHTKADSKQQRLFASKPLVLSHVLFFALHNIETNCSVSSK